MKLFPFSHGRSIAWRSRIGPPPCRSRTTQISPTRLCTSRWPSNSAPSGMGVGSPHLDGWPRERRHCPKQQRWGPRSVSSRRRGRTNSWSRSRGGTGHTPSRRICWKISGRFWRQGRPAEGQPFFLDILHSLALNIQDPDHAIWNKGSHWGSRTHPGFAGYLATQEGAKRGGAGVSGTPSSHAGVTTPQRIISVSSSAARSWRRSP